MTMTYKPEVDGLRAIAVLLVLICHMQLGLAGGYIGVDIFFVISGYLITSGLLYGMTQKNFSFRKFYVKRFIRLYPALLVTVALCLIIGFFLTDPEMMRWIARSGKYVLISASNIFFYNHTGYFDIDAHKQVFLHTWSLGVEWQFYFMWPLLVWGILKFSRKLLIASLLLITVISLIASQHMLDQHQSSAAYYLMSYRAFELGLGALLPFFYRKEIKPATGAILTFTGIAAILISSVILSPSTPFPGYAALLPCIGTVLCIFGGKAFTQGNILRNPVAIYIGKISYSAYLTHWPVLVFYRYYIFRDFLLLEKIILFILALVFGALLYHTVEARINWKKISKKLTACLLLLATTVCLWIPSSYIGSKTTNGLSWRISSDNAFNQQEYILWGAEGYPRIATLGAPNGELIAITAGDSFAGNLMYGLDVYLKEKNKKIQLFYSPACTISDLEIAKNTPPACRQTALQAFDALRANPNIPFLLIQSWGGPELFAKTPGIDLKRIQKEQLEYYALIKQNLDDLRIKFADHPIFVIGSPPYRQFAESEKDCLLRPTYLPQLCENQLQSYKPQESPVYPTNQVLAEHVQTLSNMYYIDLTQPSCGNQTCTTQRNAMLYFDGYHASQYGSVLFAQYIIEQMYKNPSAIEVNNQGQQTP